MLLEELPLCLICGSKEHPCQQKDISGDYFYNHEHPTLISQQLYIIFLLKKILHVPSDNLENYLVEFGNPTNWRISLCEQCTQLINQAKDLHFKILGISAKLKKVQKEIVDKAKLQSQPSSSPDNHDLLNDNLVYQETWQFVQNHNYDDYFREDPIFGGNQLLKTLLDEATLSTKVKTEPEETSEGQLADDDDDRSFPPDNFDDDWEPPSPKPKKRKKSTRSRAPQKRKSRSAPKIPATSDPLNPPLLSTPNAESNSDPIKLPKYLPRQCPQCPLQFRFITQLFRHLADIHSTNQLPCFHANCPEILTNRKDYIFHQSKHEKPFKCKTCGSSFLKPKSLRLHLIDKHQDQVHLLQEDRDPDPPPDKYADKKYGCDHCNFRSDSVGTLFKHLEKVHSDKVELRCPFEETCEEILRGPTQWHIHKKVHGGKGKMPVTCHLCGERITKQHLKRHISRKHKDNLDGGLLKCLVKGCAGWFFGKEGLDRHINIYHGGLDEGGEGVVKVRFSCSFCGKGFFQKRGLERHELIHKNEESKPFICELCGKGFATSGNLYEHKRYSHYKTSLKLLKLKKFKKGVKVEKGEEKEGDGIGGMGS